MLVVAAALSVFSVPAYCGDEDQAPAYMIYIDPETGKYTTENPDNAATTHAVVDASQAPASKRSSASLLITGATLLVILLAAGIVKHQRKQII